MILIRNLSLSPDAPESELLARAAELLRVSPEDILSLHIRKKALDARKREQLHFVYNVGVETGRDKVLAARSRHPDVSLESEDGYAPPRPLSVSGPRPVVAGAGPAGLFCALILSLAGLRPILLERGRPVEERQRDVERFWNTGMLDPESNVQFGEGGAGTFSDGKLNTGTRDPRHRFILEEFVRMGAPEDILYLAKPHIGTDRLRGVVANLRKQLISLGCEVRFGHRLEELRLRDGRLSGLLVAEPGGGCELPASALVLAVGHSARDTFSMLHRAGVPMEQKNFAVGVRIEHSQSVMDRVQYKALAGHPALPPADYKLSCHLPSGRSAYSFCVCPGGTVVAAASEPGRLVTNGMSEYARDGENINGGFLVGVGPEDFGSSHPLAGVEFQRKLEEAAFRLGGGGFRAPAQTVGDFLAGVPSSGPGEVRPTYRPAVTWTDLSLCLPPFVAETLRQALPVLDRKVGGYAHPHALLTGVETRSSSPVRITRGADCQSAVRGIFPCGEGAGYAGGILSAAADGIRCAEAVCAGLTSGETDIS